jgi:stage II sporulation protein D
VTRLILALVAVMVALVAAPAAGAAPASDAVLVVSGPVRITGAGAVKVGDGARYAGAMEVALDAPGTVGAVNEVPLETYVEGIAEMPSSWAPAALEAQAVAARTYALWNTAQPAIGSRVRLHYDICASTACQVYAGLDKAEEPNGRWRAAAAATAGHPAGRPILARYSSTSGGRTRFNQDVFVGEGEFPWLVATDAAEEDGESPLYRWHAEVPRADVERILDESVELRPEGHLAGLTVTVPPEGSGLPTQVVIGGSGGERVVRASTFSRAFSDTSERLFPDRYPGDLPSTIVSSRFGLDLGPDKLVIDGQGYGHGVGLSQYGAKGLADAGADAAAILAHYYGGLAPTTVVSDRPVRVGVVEEERAITLTVEGAARLEDVHGRLLAEGVTGRLVVRPRDDGALEIAGATPVAPVLSGFDLERAEAPAGDLPRGLVVTSGPLTATITAVDLSATVVTGTPVAFPAGGRWLVDLPPLPAGTWRLTVGGDPAAGEVRLRVAPRPPPAAHPGGAAAPAGRRTALAAVAAAALFMAFAAFAFAVVRRRRPPP